MSTEPVTRTTTQSLGDAITRAGEHLLPSVRCEVTSGRMAVAPGPGSSGCLHGDDGVVCWGSTAGGPWRADVTRDGIPLTAVEVELLQGLPAAVADVGAIGPVIGGPLSKGVLLEEVLVARLLHRRTGGDVPEEATGTLLGAIRELSMRRYEGRAATSGVLVVRDVDRWLAAVEADPHLTADPFAAPLHLDHAFFDQPASHRYVDGRHCIYVVGPDLSVPGLVRRLDARHLDEQDIALGLHVQRLLEACGPAWCATVDANSTVDVFGTGGLHLRWRSYHWRLMDPALVPDRFVTAGMDAIDARTLAGSLLALSDARLGTVVLVPTGHRTPAIAGMMDSSACGAALLTHLVGRRIGDLRADGTLLGILSCDGLSIVSPEGDLQMTGAIIELSDGEGGASGGGRTRAAATASHSGLVAMVSSDGQLTLHEDGRTVLHLER